MDKDLVRVTDVTDRCISPGGTTKVETTTYLTYSDGSYETSSRTCGVPIASVTGGNQYAINQEPISCGSNIQQLPEVQDLSSASSPSVIHYQSLQQHRNAPYAVASTSRMSTPATNVRYQTPPIREVSYDANYHQPMQFPDVFGSSLQQYQQQSSYLHQSSLAHPQLRNQQDVNFSQSQQVSPQSASVLVPPRLSQRRYRACTDPQAEMNQHYLQQLSRSYSRYRRSSQEQQPYLYPSQVQDPYGGESSEDELDTQLYSRQSQLASLLYSEQHFNQQSGVNEQSPGPSTSYRAPNQQSPYPDFPSYLPKLSTSELAIQALVEEQCKHILTTKPETIASNLVKPILSQFSLNQAQPQVFSPDVTLNLSQLNDPESHPSPSEEPEVEEDGDLADEDCVEDEEGCTEDAQDCIEDGDDCLEDESSENDEQSHKEFSATTALHSYARATPTAATPVAVEPLTTVRSTTLLTVAATAAVEGTLTGGPDAALYAVATTSTATSSIVETAVPAADEELGVENRFIGQAFVESQDVELGETLLSTPQVNPTTPSRETGEWSEEEESYEDVTPEGQSPLTSDTENGKADSNFAPVILSENAAVPSEIVDSRYLASEKSKSVLSLDKDHETEQNNEVLGIGQINSSDEEQSGESLHDEEISKENEDELTPVKESKIDSEEVECIQTTGFVKLREMRSPNGKGEKKLRDKSDLGVAKRLAENMPSTSNSLNVGNNPLFNIHDFGSSNITFGSFLPGSLLQNYKLPNLIPLEQFREQQMSLTTDKSSNISARIKECPHPLPYSEQSEVPSIPQPTSQRNLNPLMSQFPLPNPRNTAGLDNAAISLDSFQQEGHSEGPPPLAQLEGSLEHRKSPDDPSAQTNSNLSQSDYSEIHTHSFVLPGESEENSCSLSHSTQPTQTNFNVSATNFSSQVNSPNSSVLVGSAESLSPVPPATTSNQSLPVPPQPNFPFHPSYPCFLSGQAGVPQRPIRSTRGLRRRRALLQTPYRGVAPMGSMNPGSSQAYRSATPQGYRDNVPYPRGMYNPSNVLNYSYPPPHFPFPLQGLPFNPSFPPPWGVNLPFFSLPSNKSQNQNNGRG